MMEEDASRNEAPSEAGGGTGLHFASYVIILAGIAALAATLMTLVSIWLQLKNYRKPLLQRYVVRILIMVPIYSAASWTSLTSQNIAFWVDPFRDVYEAFTIYTFLQLLINFIGGERQLIIMTHGRAPIAHFWPLSHCLAKVDISDPHSFLAIKRGILQYTWIKPILAIATVVMKATNTYDEGIISATSGYFWSGLIYNVSITVSLYSLAIFWVCMASDLKPFRPMPKFLCIKGIIFASYWQGFFLSILVFLGAIPKDVRGYTQDNLAAAIQDALICFEMPAFAIAHWYAFSWKDYADATISAARMPVKFALRDAFGPRDLIEDAKETFAGQKYEYRYFDAGDNILAHEESQQRAAKLSQGMRYARSGKGKYWIPAPGQGDGSTPLLHGGNEEGSIAVGSAGVNGHTSTSYGTADNRIFGEEALDAEDERLYAKARSHEYGDWNYPVITAHHATREDRLYASPSIITASTNRNLLQPTKEFKQRRKGKIQDIQRAQDPSKQERDDRDSSHSHEQGEPGASSASPDQLIDLVVEDDEAEEIERVRARKSGNPEWNKSEGKHFVRAYSESEQEVVVHRRPSVRGDPDATALEPSGQSEHHDYGGFESSERPPKWNNEELESNVWGTGDQRS